MFVTISIHRNIEIPEGWREVKTSYEKVKEGDKFLNLLELEKGKIVFEDVSLEDIEIKFEYVLLIRKK